MYARTTTLQAQPGSIDAGIANFRDVTLPALQGIDGYVGGSLIVDRESGLCIATTNWASPEARRASAELVMPIRDQALAVMGAESSEVADWELAVVHRDHHAPEGACVRATWSKVDPSEAERGIGFWKLAILPAVEQWDGFCSGSLMVNRDAGLAVGTITFDSRSAMEATREQAAQVRAGATREMGGLEILDVRELELAVAHLHAPEMV